MKEPDKGVAHRTAAPLRASGHPRNSEPRSESRRSPRRPRPARARHHRIFVERSRTVGLPISPRATFSAARGIDPGHPFFGERTFHGGESRSRDFAAVGRQGEHRPPRFRIRRSRESFEASPIPRGSCDSGASRIRPARIPLEEPAKTTVTKKAILDRERAAEEDEVRIVSTSRVH